MAGGSISDSISTVRTVSAVQPLRARNKVLPGFDFRIDYAARTRQGAERGQNQDGMLASAQHGVFAVADGMGGHAAGDVASRLALQTVAEQLASPEAARVRTRYADEPEIESRRAVYRLLEQSVRAANDAVLELSARDEAHRGMGTTLDVVLLVRDRAFFAHVGDARAYLVRPTATLQLTHDHAAYDLLRSSGKRQSEDAASRSPLSNCIGLTRSVVVDTLYVDLALEDRIVLCTDGVVNATANEAELAGLCRGGTAAAACDTLIDSVEERDGADDATAVVIAMTARFVTRKGEAGPRARDLETMAASHLLAGLSPAQVLSTLAAGVEVEIAEGHTVPCAVANDRVAYIVLDGAISVPAGRILGRSAFVMAESLLDIAVRSELPKVAERARLLRIRYDDFNEICAHDRSLAAELYRRIAEHLARR